MNNIHAGQWHCFLNNNGGAFVSPSHLYYIYHVQHVDIVTNGGFVPSEIGWRWNWRDWINPHQNIHTPFPACQLTTFTQTLIRRYAHSVFVAFTRRVRIKLQHSHSKNTVKGALELFMWDIWTLNSVTQVWPLVPYGHCHRSLHMFQRSPMFHPPKVDRLRIMKTLRPPSGRQERHCNWREISFSLLTPPPSLIRTFRPWTGKAAR